MLAKRPYPGRPRDQTLANAFGWRITTEGHTYFLGRCINPECEGHIGNDDCDMRVWPMFLYFAAILIFIALISGVVILIHWWIAN